MSEFVLIEVLENEAHICDRGTKEDMIAAGVKILTDFEYPEKYIEEFQEYGLYITNDSPPYTLQVVELPEVEV